MNHMFYNCRSLTNLNLSNWKTNNVTDMNCMFDGCSSLTKLDLSHFITDNVTDMLWMFNKCFKEKHTSTLICTASTIKKITNSSEGSYLTITNEKKNKINDILNKDNKWKVYTCIVKRGGNENSPQITEVA